MIEDNYAMAEERMRKTLEITGQHLAGIRTGRATAGLLDGVRVEYYGSMVPLSHVANINIPEPRLIVIQPWDRGLIPEIEKAIQASNLGLNPSNDGNVIRLPVPPLSEERRRDLVKVARKLAEEGRVAIRNIRREANDALKKAQREKVISEDDSKRAMADIQELTDKYIKLIDQLLEKKEQEIMEV